VDGSVNSNYNALNLKLQQRFSKGFTYLLGFTWSKAIDTGSAIRTNNGDRLFPNYSYDMAHERGLSQFHTGRRFVGSILYELPFGRGRTFANSSRIADAVIGGWQLGSIITFSDGNPWNVGALGDRAAIGADNWPDATGISSLPSDRSASRFWDIRAFDATNPQLQYRSGSAGRNVVFTPGVRQWDFSIAKHWSITEGHRLEFRFESFNFGNHPNWGVPSANVNQPATFGVVTGARTMRENQFALKYVF
jgi:hypothetical protein